MTSYSASRRHALAAAYILAACTEVRETTIEITADTCRTATDQQMNTYVVQLYEASEGVNLGESCGLCASTTCAEKMRRCACGPDVAAVRDVLESQLQGLRFGDVDASKNYCLRVLALELTPVATSSTCECPDGWETDVAMTARLCGVSNVFVTNTSAPVGINNLVCPAEDNQPFRFCVERIGQ